MLICAPFLEYKEEKNRFVNTEIVCVDVLCDDLIECIKNDGEEAFFTKYTGYDHLLICDVECLAGKMQTQSEIAKLIYMRDDAGKSTTFLSSVTAERVRDDLKPDLFKLITKDGLLDRF
ncbi:MAG: hypothetical protein IKU84_05015 [Clostridia bacterium]|nr:hypothetical protein [Clostridia bacterium]